MALKLSFRIVLLVIPLLAVIAGTNYIMDPALLFHSSFIEEVAQGITEGSNAALTADNYDERKLQKLLIEGFSGTPDGIVLGSSRVMCIPCDALGFGQGFCHGVSGAVIEDMVSIVGMYEKKGHLPENVVIGIDPWLLNANHGDTRYRELIPEYNMFAEQLSVSAIKGEKVYSKNLYIMKAEQLLSPTYFQSSLVRIMRTPTSLPEALRTVGDEPSPLIGSSVHPDYTNKLADGSIIYAETMHMQSEEAVSRSVAETIAAGTFYHSAGYREFSPEITDQLAKLIAFLQSRDISVTFVLPPLHPMFYDYITEHKEYQMLIASDSFIRTFAEERGIRVIGSVNPHRIGAQNSDFYDFMHPTREFMTAMCKSAF